MSEKLIIGVRLTHKGYRGYVAPAGFGGIPTKAIWTGPIERNEGTAWSAAQAKADEIDRQVLIDDPVAGRFILPLRPHSYVRKSELS